TELLWRQVGVNGLISDPQLPYFISWDSPAELHPGFGGTGEFSLACLEIAGDPQRVSEWLGQTVEAPLEDVKVEWVAPNGTPGIVAVQLQTPQGLVRI
ncbi:MAG: VOC family protein, partial [Marmoricola sp.]